MPTDVNDNGLTDAGDTIAFTFTVTNTGVLPLSASAFPTRRSDLSRARIRPSQPASRRPAPRTTSTRSPRRTRLPVSVTNTATASGVPPGTTPPEPARRRLRRQRRPRVPGRSVSIIKTESRQAGRKPPAGLGETISYTYLVTNIGNVVLTSVAVSDPTLGSVTCPTILRHPASASETSVTCTADSVYVVTASRCRTRVRDRHRDRDRRGRHRRHAALRRIRRPRSSRPSRPRPRWRSSKLADVTPAADQDAAAARRHRPLLLSGHQHRQRQPDVGGGRRPDHRPRHLPHSGATGGLATGELGDLHRRRAAHRHAGRPRCRRGDRYRHRHRGRRGGRRQPAVRPGHGHDSDGGRGDPQVSIVKTRRRVIRQPIRAACSSMTRSPTPTS